MPHDPYRALYIHIPFCVKRCKYCDFATQAVKKDDAQIDDYIEHLVVELRKKAREGELAHIQTAYIGGGTPSHIGMSRLSSLLYAISTSVDLTREDFEFTMEANPESLDDRMVRDIWAMGVNRLSIGVQSFDDNILKMLGRAHSADDARNAIDCAHERFENVSVDLMCGIPGQSSESLASSIEQAISLGVTHMSIYPLSIEMHTPFYNDVMHGYMDDVDEDTQADHMQLASAMLEEAGFRRYEVANYARPGFESRHNCAYWLGIPYLGIGQSATTMTQNEQRRMRMTDGVVTDDLNRRQMEAENLMLGMRLVQGVSNEQVHEASLLLEGVEELFDDLENRYGLVAHEDGRWKPTERGWLCGNELYERILDLAP